MVGDQAEQRSILSMVVAEFHFFQVERKLPLGNTMIFHQSFLCKGPEAFQAVDIDSPLGKTLGMVYTQMTVSTAHQCVVTAEFVRIYNAATAHFLHRQGQQRFRCHVLHRLYTRHAVPLEDAEHRNLPGRAAAAFPFPLSAEIGLIHFDFPGQQQFLPRLRGCHQRVSNRIRRLQSGRIAQLRLRGDLPCRNLQLKQFDDPYPLATRNLDLIDPSAAERMMGATA